jgi:hypothetical protein
LVALCSLRPNGSEDARPHLHGLELVVEIQVAIDACSARTGLMSRTPPHALDADTPARDIEQAISSPRIGASEIAGPLKAGLEVDPQPVARVTEGCWVSRHCGCRDEQNREKAGT